MTKRALIVASIVGLVAAIVAALLVRGAAADATADLLVLGLDIVAAGIAGRVILGQARAHRYFVLGTVVSSAVAAIILTTALSNYLIQLAVLGPVTYSPSSTIVIEVVVGFVVYLLAATIYGFAGTRQGVTVGNRVAFLLLLLLAVFPLLNVLGLIGFTITTLVRGGVTPARPAVSE